MIPYRAIPHIKWSMIFFVAVGCGDQRVGSVHESEINVIETGAVESVPPASLSALQEYDFGIVFSDKKQMDHVFEFYNSESTPLKLIKITALTPCCSAVGPIPDSIPPKSSVSIPAVFRPGATTGRARVEFVVETDSKSVPMRTLRLVATIIPQVEIERKDSPPSLEVGEEGRCHFLIRCRRDGKTGLKLPDQVKTSSGISASWLGKPVQNSESLSLIVEERELEVVLKPAVKSGHRREEVRLAWSSGQTRQEVVAWSVKPPLSAQPSGFVANSEESVAEFAKTLTLQSKRPFRVLSLQGSCLKEWAVVSGMNAANSHQCRLTFVPRVGDEPRLETVKIATDHPDQPEVEISVLYLARKKG